jgi:hypothetical protein
MVGHYHAVACKNGRVHTILTTVIQKLIIPVDQHSPKSPQMTGFEFGPSVARGS